MGEAIQRIVPIAKVNAKKRIVYGVVYAPGDPDAHDQFMNAETIENMAHRFMMASQKMDEQHDFIDGAALPVESFIVRDGDKDFVDDKGKTLVGAWVIGSKIIDDQLWKKIQKGEIKAYSIAGVGTMGKQQEMDSKWYDNEGNRINPYEEQ